MKTKLFCAALAIGLVLIGGSIFASNMGFKIVRSVNVEGGLNVNYLGLPYNFPDVSGNSGDGIPDGQVNAADVMYDIGWAACGQVSKWDAPNQAWINYAGGARETPFTFDKGAGLLVKMSSDVPSYVIVGSHDPAHSMTYDVQGGLNVNYINVPYHFKDVSGNSGDGIPDGQLNAADVMYDLGWAACGQVSKWDAANQAWVNYAGGARETPFTFSPGSAMLIKLSGQVNWTPSHY